MTKTTRKRTVLAGMAAALLLAACADDAGDMADAPAAAEGGTVVATAQGAPGTFLTDATGMSLYLFTNDTPGVSNCTGDCLVAWPALLTDGDPVAGDGVDASLLGTTIRDDGSVQVTYSGWPLYFFAGDAAPGDLAGQGVNDVWFVVSPTGEMLMMEGDLDEDTSMGGYGSSDGYGDSRY